MVPAMLSQNRDTIFCGKNRLAAAAATGLAGAAVLLVRVPAPDPCISAVAAAIRTQPFLCGTLDRAVMTITGGMPFSFSFQRHGGAKRALALSLQ